MTNRPDPNPASRLLGPVRRSIERGPGRGLVVAVSGGSDSVGLLRTLHALAPEMGLTLSVAHLDHGARPESREDARFVAELAESLALPFDLGHWSPARAGHFEADARRARYAWLAAVARLRGAACVAVGHTRDDQAETILHRILRGTGPRGLAGMAPRRRLEEGVMLVRPLLGVSRGEVRAYLAGLGQGFHDDPTNDDLARTRSRIRHDLLPKLAAEYNPRVAEALVRLGRLAGAGERATAVELERVASQWPVDADRAVINREVLLSYPSVRRADLLRLVWRRAGWPEAGMGEDRWRRMAALAESRGARASIGAGVELRTDAHQFVLERAAAEDVSAAGDAIPLELSGSASWRGGRIVATLDPDEPRDETIDLDEASPPFSVRPPRPGDRFAPLGMAQETPLNDFFRGRRVPRPERPRVPLVCDGRGIVWVVGHRIGHRVRLTERTRRTLGLRWEPTCD